MKERTVFFVHHTARDEYKKLASGLAETMRESELYELKFPPKKLAEEVKTVVVVGGDGSVRSVSEKLLKEDNNRRLLILPAGSQNSFYRALSKANAVVTLEQLQTAEYPDIREFYPGVINTGPMEKRPFNHVAGFGKPIIRENLFNEKMRGKIYPRTAKTTLAAIYTVFRSTVASSNTERGVDLFVTSPYLGRMKLFPNQGLYDEELTRIVVKGEGRVATLAKAGLIFFFAATRKEIPVSVVRLEKGTAFSVKDRYYNVSIDGEAWDLDSDEVTVSRSEKGIKVAAIVK